MKYFLRDAKNRTCRRFQVMDTKYGQEISYISGRFILIYTEQESPNTFLFVLMDEVKDKNPKSMGYDIETFP